MTQDSHTRQCQICAYGVENIDFAMTNVAISQIVDCSEASVRRHRKWAEVNGIDPGVSFAVAPFTAPLANPDNPVNLRVRRVWDGPDGEPRFSYENVAEAESEVHLDNDRIDSLIRDWPVGSLVSADTPCDALFPADLQLGKVDRGGGTDGTIERFQVAIEQGAQRWALLKPRVGILADLGDLIENIYSTKSQVSTNDRTLPEQIEDAVALYMNAIGKLRPLVEELWVATVTSNHGEVRSEMKINPYGSENDWGLMIFRIIQGKCDDRGWDVKFFRPDIEEDTAVLELPDGTKIALTHGHHSSSPAQMKTWIERQVVGRRPGWDADLWVHGHYHHSGFGTFGDGRYFFGTPSLDPGSAWFTRKSGESSPPGITALTLANHRWSNHTILR